VNHQDINFMAERQNIEEVQKQLAEEIRTMLSLKAGAVLPDTALAPLGIDSLRFVSLLIIIEQKFGVSLMKVGLKPEDMKSVRTLSAAICAGNGV
jgi:acyl carrier protein